MKRSVVALAALLLACGGGESGDAWVADVDGVRVVVFNLGGEFHAIEDVCFA